MNASAAFSFFEAVVLLAGSHAELGASPLQVVLESQYKCI
ncbi:hypothetical protein EV14_1947 [Prochlorococcus sp. MIT 0703]|nr:hypothetical protein EV12_0864 [Prochlorococcus sp. MIT 0701]KGG32806.1 hypothetical protein EV14_1947 [Prochlorococcus sp. MIT 0703]